LVKGDYKIKVLCDNQVKIQLKSIQAYFIIVGKLQNKINNIEFHIYMPKQERNLVVIRSRGLLRAVEILGLNIVSSRQSTYWPTDRDKTPDLIDFFIIKDQ